MFEVQFFDTLQLLVCVQPVSDAFHHYTSVRLWRRKRLNDAALQYLLLNHNPNKNAPPQLHTFIELLILEMKMALRDITIRPLIALLSLH